MKFYSRLIVCLCLVITFLVVVIMLAGVSFFVGEAFAQDNYAQKSAASQKLKTVNSLSLQDDFVIRHPPLMIHSDNKFANPKTTSSDESDLDLQVLDQKLTDTQENKTPKYSRENAAVAPKNNYRNNNKTSSKKTSNSKIRLAAVNSEDEDDRVVPAAPMPSSGTPNNSSGRRDRSEGDNGNNYLEQRVASNNSVGRFEPNNVTNIPNTAARNLQEQPNPPNEARRPNQQPPIDPYHPPINTAAFNNVVPGHSSIKSVVEFWGEPVKETTKDGELVQLYKLHELDHIEVTYNRDKIVKSIVVRFDEAFPENLVREQFETMLLKSRPVLIPDETGKIIGELFPEKGVVFIFSGGKSGGMFQVRQIGIEPVISEPFVLRAEATLNDQPSESYRDLLDAIRINRNDAKAYWLLAKVELLRGYTETAISNAQRAIRFDERKPAYHLTLAQALSRMNRIEDAKLYLEETLSICERFPTDKARALCLLGDFYRTGQNPDCENAYKLHSAAIEIADQLADHSNPTIRQTAKDILFELYLAVAKDIAWGRWRGKERAIDNWLAGAESIMTDPEMVAVRRFSSEYPLKLAICELACQVGIRGEGDIELYVKEAIQAGERLVSKTNDPILLQKLRWEIGIAVYDAVQIYQLRGEYEFALRYGELAADYMESGIRGRANDSDLYLLGRLYFRLGTIHALGDKNHRAAIEWFNKAKPTFERLFPNINPEESGRYGESLVSMGVSYWVTNQREEAVRLTERGLRQIERGVKLGFTSESAFAIPYSNLTNMYNELGNVERSRHYSNLSSSLKYNRK
ncbi:MAG: hypothetical protein LBJ00_05495 [Planctomycetaceae bacterium]|jgi:tetratricopeptide (TPR) repeat protein|nr:hypothetical protein [Planctomycetaceae bacterium]